MKGKNLFVSMSRAGLRALMQKNKKFYWWAFYLFSGLAVMAKGIPGVVIPFGTVFFASIVTGKLKEIFKPLYFIPGIVIFLLVVLPWHIVMLKKYDPLFYNEYIIKHHLHRFLNTSHNEIGRKQPFYYYLVVILWGFIPWIFSTIAVCIARFKEIMAANINAALDKCEDPSKMIDQYLRDLESDFGKVKAETAAIMAEETRAKREVLLNETIPVELL